MYRLPHAHITPRAAVSTDHGHLVRNPVNSSSEAESSRKTDRGVPKEGGGTSRVGFLSGTRDRSGGRRLQAGDSAMVRIWISMIREPGDCLQANKTAPATSSGSSIPSC